MKERRRAIVWFPAFQAAADAITLWAGLEIAFWIRFSSGWIPAPKGVPDLDLYRRVFGLALPLWMGLFIYGGHYRRGPRDLYDEFVLILKHLGLGLLLLLAATFFYREFTYSRLYLGIAAILLPPSLLLERAFLRWLRGRLAGRWVRPHRILVLGAGRVADHLDRRLWKEKHLRHYRAAQMDPEALEAFCRQREVDEVILAGRSDLARAQILAETCEKIGCEFKFVPDLLDFRLGELSVDDSLGLPALHLRPPALRGVNFLLKRMVDLTLAAVLLLLLAVPMALIAFGIWIHDRGPVFYSQERVGRGGRIFRFWKFRTMVPTADAMLEPLLSRSERKGPVFKMSRDPRVTPFGRFLRRFSLDELPQLFNVLKGEMSLVGPRPQVVWEANHYDGVARRRLSVLPGITGLWQVSGRADLPYEDMIRLDLYYLENWSLGLDLKILLKTPAAVLSSRGAY